MKHFDFSHFVVSLYLSRKRKFTSFQIAAGEDLLKSQPVCFCHYYKSADRRPCVSEHCLQFKSTREMLTLTLTLMLMWAKTEENAVN